MAGFVNRNAGSWNFIDLIFSRIIWWDSSFMLLGKAVSSPLLLKS